MAQNLPKYSPFKQKMPNSWNKKADRAMFNLSCRPPYVTENYSIFANYMTSALFSSLLNEINSCPN